MDLGEGVHQLLAVLGGGESDLGTEVGEAGLIDLKGLGREEGVSFGEPFGGLLGGEGAGRRLWLGAGLGLEHGAEELNHVGELGLLLGLPPQRQQDLVVASYRRIVGVGQRSAPLPPPLVRRSLLASVVGLREQRKVTRHQAEGDDAGRHDAEGDEELHPVRHV